QPPHPGLPLHAPSVQMSTCLLLILFLTDCLTPAICRTVGLAPGHHGLRAQLLLALFPCRANQTHARNTLHRRDHVEGSAERPPAITGLLHKRPPLDPASGDTGRHIAAEVAPIDFEGQELEPVFEPD